MVPAERPDGGRSGNGEGCILKTSTEVFKLFRYTYGRVPVDIGIAQANCPNWTVRAVNANRHCARNTRFHSFIVEAFDLDTLREFAEAFTCRGQPVTVPLWVFVEVLNKGIPALTKCLPLGHFAIARVDNDSKFMAMALASSTILLQTYSGIGCGGKELPTRSAMTLADGIQVSRTGGSVRGAAGASDVEGAASISLRGRFGDEASGSSSCGRRDPAEG
ncbi:Hypothetical protein PHPALM_12879 [Phytophthora palmivora]|uniref:Uncharacterized protein n=1 Tax=Phytophthora palmivora TaxID=4796 RepID=A0A2P4XYN1_9STRA|nr:Hypothetical protein PHPALM_12879 [Phytophthora palmivora]